MHPFQAWLYSFIPAPVTASWRERFYGVLGACLGLIITEGISHQALGSANPWFIAPMGASAVLLFAVPASPLAQPWSIIGGNLVAAFIGVSCSLLIEDRGLAAGLAVGLSIGAMFALRCLHPPSGAIALTAVLGGPAVQALGYHFLLWPVLLDSVLLLGMALIFNNALRRRYPHPHMEHRNPHKTSDPLPSQRTGFTPGDLDAVLAARNEVLDISKDDLEEILLAAEARAQQRHFGNIVCADIMSRDIATVTAETSLQEAWQKLSHHRITALPVVTPEQQLAGIVSLHDFFVSRENGLPEPVPAAGRVLDIMTPNVVTAGPGTGLAELVKLFSDGGLHHLPVIAEDRSVLGMVTQSDLVAALFHAGHA
ncbi:MAG: HPP family protein [Pedobacter sp.]|nr:HPP family protein [Pedobacter sp.]